MDDDREAAFQAWLRTLPSRQELAIRLAFVDRVPGMADRVGWANRIGELRQLLRLTGKGALAKVRAGRDYSDALDVIAAIAGPGGAKTKRPRPRQPKQA